jgi:TRAP-type C4-dicarboxylate transport system permease small subunit
VSGPEPSKRRASPHGPSASTRGQHRWRRAVRDIALLLCAAVAAYLLTALTIAPLAVVVARYLQNVGASWYVAFGAATLLDLGKLVGLLPVGWMVRRAVSIRPALAAVMLVFLCYGLELAVMVILQQAAWAWRSPTIWLARAVVGLLSSVVVASVMRRGKGQDGRATS